MWSLCGVKVTTGLQLNALLKINVYQTKDGCHDNETNLEIYETTVLLDK